MHSQSKEKHLPIDRLDELVSKMMNAKGGLLKIVLRQESVKENVLEFLKINGYTYSVSSHAYETQVEIELEQLTLYSEKGLQGKPTLLDQLLLVQSEQVGSDNGQYSKALMQSILMAWFEESPLPEKVVFMGRGVLLLKDSGLLLEKLKWVKSFGVEIYASASCLEYYGVTAPFEWIEVSSVLTLVKKMKRIKNLITL